MKKNINTSTTILIAAILFTVFSCRPEPSPVNIDYIDQFNVVWETQSKESSESMPVGGGDIGCNVWVENGDILFYMSRSGTFDENNSKLKMGRTRIQLDPNPFEGKESTFHQELNLREGCVYISGKNEEAEAAVKIWVEVFHPVIHVDIESSVPVTVNSTYETWRTKDHELSQNERMQCLSFLGTLPEQIPLKTYKDSVSYSNSKIIWYHRNRNDDLVFDKEITQQHLDPIREKLWNPLKNLTFGGSMQGVNMSFSNTVTGRYMHNNFKGWVLQSESPDTKHQLDILLHVAQTETDKSWNNGLEKLKDDMPSRSEAWDRNLNWWEQYWDRSHIVINGDLENKHDDKGWQIGRNYQLFRYMLGCNAYGEYPTKFNGGLFTVDGGYEGYTPDFRLWGGGSFTAQNQRLVYWPMLKSGDFDMMISQFEYYLRGLKNAELRTEYYWGHKGPSFSEQIANFGLPIGDIYHYHWGNERLGPRKDKYAMRYLTQASGDTLEVLDHGYLNNNWVSDQYETILEFCLMILDTERYNSADISRYMPLIESSLVFFDEHFQYWHKKLNGSSLNEEGKLVIYPSTALETYKMAENPTPLIAGLKTVLSRMLELPEKYLDQQEKEKWRNYLERVPEISLMEKEGYTLIAPAKNWERLSNQEFPQMYPVFPYNQYGLGKADLEVAINTWNHGADIPAQKGSQCWFQSGIFCARMGLVEEARDYLEKKMLAQSKRFTAFWEVPGFDQWPDIDHGGAGMLNLQEMLLQTDGKQIRVIPAWPMEWEVDFKLHAPYQTTIEGQVKNGDITFLDVTPEERQVDIINTDQ